ncbi:hypothetical protein JDV02_008878 [Purpureocillium takamizusanense]|uniref:Protein kinase domain-containing protein n=1 Tax=Purpureocillium takamizusanense TaxID=2060973 RepID=A0A9Q8QNM1_9HYPO|nr:uncharacterized protein JDV02_008878 [Purpureocillium takamizusanense]UNI23035.1 hypothetical protein JDV02_008878 [Purpureocillium takamizusanense]
MQEITHRREPHPLALFSLAPMSPGARDAVLHRANDHLRSACRGIQDFVLNVGHVQSRRNDDTLASMGRDGDVVLQGSSISKLQCAFEIDPSLHFIVLHDKSSHWNTQVYGENATPFPSGCMPRRVRVSPHQNTRIGMGGRNGDVIVFNLIWHQQHDLAISQVIEERRHTRLEENPAFSMTGHGDEDTAAPSSTSRLLSIMANYVLLGKLGQGQYGQVYKATHRLTGQSMAVKFLTSAPERRGRMKREVDALSQLHHDNIVNYLGMEDWQTTSPKIFMGLKDGCAKELIWNMRGGDASTTLRVMLHHMLQALDYLDVKGIVHRDLKPENILYERRVGGYRFVLGDFGLCNSTDLAATIGAGTFIYMAPEMLQRGMQTPKVDIWSLFVTYLSLSSQGGRFYEEARAKHSAGRFAPADHELVVALVLSFAGHQDVAHIREMAVRDPVGRASAAYMLVKLFGGHGLTTPVENLASRLIARGRIH